MHQPALRVGTVSCPHHDDADVELDGIPTVFVNPAEPDIAGVKHRAAALGQNVIVSEVIPLGKKYLAPLGMPVFDRD